MSTLLALALVAGLVAATPRARAALDKQTGFDPWAIRVSPVERAFTGGIVALRSPASTMIRVRGSTFTMGSTVIEAFEAAADCAREPLGFRCNETSFRDELPEHRVTLSSYWLDRTEVTVLAYERCVALGRCRAVAFDQGARRFERDDLPVSLVSWQDASDYCSFRAARLPTEAEFERAARGPRKRRYPWGNLYNSHAANHGRLGWDVSDASDGFAELAPVGSYPAGRTPDGFLDLAGNVAEWVSDRYLPQYAVAGAERDPKGPNAPPASSERVVRGGSYAQAGPWLRGAARRFQDPDARRPYVGFRCARSAARGVKDAG